MGAKTALSEEQYLHTSFTDLDKEFRDGELVERSLPNFDHGRVQGRFFSFFDNLRRRLPIFTSVETRIKLRPGRYLIPDVSVFYPNKPTLLPDKPPLVAIEVLSPDDRRSGFEAKLDEYRGWGVPHVWLVDPDTKKMYVWEGALNEVPSLLLPELQLEITPGDIFD